MLTIRCDKTKSRREWHVSIKQLILRMVEIIRRILYSLYSNLLAAIPQGIAALAAQGGVATLTERSDATFEVMQFSSADENEAPQDARYSRQESIEVRPLVPKGIFQLRKTEICQMNCFFISRYNIRLSSSSNNSSFFSA